RGLRAGREIAADVGPGAEGALASSGQHDAAAVTPAELVPHSSELPHHRPGHGVEPPLVVDRHHHDVPPVPLHADLRHRGSTTTTTLPCALRSVSSRIA